MTKQEFAKAEIEWAEGILAEPEYTMANGKSSHVVAYEVASAALDRLVEMGRVTAYREWA